MAQKPVANALILELEPVVGENVDRHLDTENLWFAHDFVPFEQGENFAFLGGRDWDPSQVTLPKAITDACEILLITKDNVAGYHRELVEHFILEDNVGPVDRPVDRRRTPARHCTARVLRGDPRDRPHRQRAGPLRARVMKGYRADQYSQVETLVFMAFFERAHAVYCNNLAAQIEEPVLAGLIAHIARDEERHEEFFANLVAHCLGYTRDETIAAIAARAAELQVVGADIDAYQDKVRNVADAGIFGPDQLRRVISDRITAWGLADEPALRQFVIG